MPLPAALRELDSTQRHTVIASFLGWTLDAFDYFLLTFVILAVAAEFHVSKQEVTYGLFLTLAARPIGALLFGRLADRYGRRPVLMFDIVLFSVLEVACAFAPTLGVLLGLRFLFGIAMGGEWGIGASLAMESIPAKSRGFVSGLLQSGYPCGFFLAALANWLLAFSLSVPRPRCSCCTSAARCRNRRYGKVGVPRPAKACSSPCGATGSGSST